MVCRAERHDDDADCGGDGEQLHDAGADDHDELLGARVERERQRQLGDRHDHGPPSPPTITTQPASQTIASGQTATLSVVATGTAPLGVSVVCRAERHDDDADCGGDGEQLHDAGADDHDELLGARVERERHRQLGDGDDHGRRGPACHGRVCAHGYHHAGQLVGRVRERRLRAGQRCHGAAQLRPGGVGGAAKPHVGGVHHRSAGAPAARGDGPPCRDVVLPATSYTIDVNITDGATHQVALYNLDWDGANTRTQRVDVLNATTGAVLDTRTVTAFSNGQYLVWTIGGHVTFRVTNTGPANAVVSGLFFR